MGRRDKKRNKGEKRRVETMRNNSPYGEKEVEQRQRKNRGRVEAELQDARIEATM